MGGPSKQQRSDVSKDQHPTAGPSQDDRGGDWDGQQAAMRASHGQIKQDIQGRIVKVSVEGDHTVISIALGTKQGVYDGLHGYVSTGGGRIADFTIVDVNETTAKAIIDVSPDALAGHGDVVVNPSSKPAIEAQHDMKSRILKTEVIGDKIEIAIGRGQLTGSSAGMKGVVVDSGGRKIAHFSVSRVDARTSYAKIDHVTLDELQSSEVILNPSDGGGAVEHKPDAGAKPGLAHAAGGKPDAGGPKPGH